MIVADFKIKPELLEQYKKQIGNNCCDPYSFCVVRAVILSFQILDNPEKGCKEAQDVWRGLGISGFMAGEAASYISHFHERGEEFRQYWNELWGVKDNSGVVNPAIWTSK